MEDRCGGGGEGVLEEVKLPISNSIQLVVFTHTVRFTLDKNFPLHSFHTQKTPTQQIVFRNHQANGEVDSMQVPLFQLQVLHCTAAQKAAVLQLPESGCGWEGGGILK